MTEAVTGPDTYQLIARGRPALYAAVIALQALTGRHVAGYTLRADPATDDLIADVTLEPIEKPKTK